MLTSGTQMIIEHRMVICLDQIHSAISNISAFQAFSSTAVINRKETGPWLVAAQLMQCCRNGAGPCNGWEEGRWGWSVTMLLRALLEGIRDILWVIIIYLSIFWCNKFKFLFRTLWKNSCTLITQQKDNGKCVLPISQESLHAFNSSKLSIFVDISINLFL